MKKIILAILSAVLVFGVVSCSTYDSSRVSSEITKLEQQLSELENKVKDINTEISTIKTLSEAEFITRISFDAAGNCVIRYVVGGISQTAVFATSASVVSSPLIGVDTYTDGKMYWRQSTDFGKTWNWILDASGNMMPVSGEAPAVGIDADGYWTVGGVSTGVLAKDYTFKIISGAAVNPDSGMVDITLADGTVISIEYREALSLSFEAPVYNAIADYNTPCTISYKVSGSLASEAVVDYFSAYNTEVTINKGSRNVDVKLKEGAESGNVIFMATCGDEIVYQPLFFTYGAIVTDLENYIKNNELITPLGDPVINLSGQMTSFTINVSHNIDVEVSVSSDASSWLRQVNTKAETVSTAYNFVADYYEAEEDIERTGSIILSNSLYATQTKLAVVQKPVILGGGGGGGGDTKGISNKADLLEFISAVNAGGSTARWENNDGEICLLADIDVSGEDSWTPAGFAQAEGSGSFEIGMAFTGVFNGQNHTISGFHFSFDATTHSRTMGFFGALEGAVVKNLVLGADGDSFTVTGSPVNNISIAGVAGYAVSTTMTNVVNNIDVIYNAECPNGLPIGLSGITGYGCNLTYGGKAKADAVVNNGDVIVKYKVATTQNGGKGIQIGGLVGMLTSGKSTVLRNCSNNGVIAAPTGRGGGLIGTIEGATSASNPTTLSNCTNSGLVTDDYFDYGYTADSKRMGGLVGGSQPTDVVIESCTNKGNVFSHNGCRSGGIIGHFNSGIITGCVNEGAILSHVTAKNADGTGGDGPGWIAGYCNTTVEGCRPGGYVGEYADFKDNPTAAPAADMTNAIGYKNSQYFDPSKNQ